MNIQKHSIYLLLLAMLGAFASCAKDEATEPPVIIDPVEPEPPVIPTDTSANYYVKFNVLYDKPAVAFLGAPSRVEQLKEKVDKAINDFNTNFNKSWAYEFYKNRADSCITSQDTLALKKYTTLKTALQAINDDLQREHVDFDYGPGHFLMIYETMVGRDGTELAERDTIRFEYSENRRFEADTASFFINTNISPSFNIRIPLTGGMEFFKAKTEFRMSVQNSSFEVYRPDHSLYIRTTENPLFYDVRTFYNEIDKQSYLFLASILENDLYNSICETPGTWNIVIRGVTDTGRAGIFVDEATISVKFEVIKRN